MILGFTAEIFEETMFPISLPMLVTILFAMVKLITGIIWRDIGNIVSSNISAVNLKTISSY